METTELDKIESMSSINIHFILFYSTKHHKHLFLVITQAKIVKEKRITLITILFYPIKLCYIIGTSLMSKPHHEK